MKKNKDNKLSYYTQKYIFIISVIIFAGALCIPTFIALYYENTPQDESLKENHELDIVVGVTNTPIFSSSDKNLLFLFGEANRRYKSAIISTYGFENVDSRIIKEIIHEVGHLILGTQHCLNKTCVMSYAKTIIEVDNKSNKLCINCENKTMKLKVERNI